MTNEYTEGLKLKDIIIFIKKRILKLALSFFIPVLIAFIVCLLLPKRYKAAAAILSPEAIAGGIISTPFGVIGSPSLGEGQIPSNAIIAILRSKNMRKDFIEEFDLINRYGLKNMDAALTLLEKRTEVYFLEAEGLVYITFESEDPLFSAKGVEFYIKNLETLNKELKLTSKNPFVEVLDAPTPPLNKSFPRTKLSMLLSGFFGLIFYLLFLWIKRELS
jgi:uncharacterized protein involved in exopolysaccharide biosynthesis